jgi:hypothetical protein
MVRAADAGAATARGQVNGQPAVRARHWKMSAPTVAALASPVRQRWSRGVRVGFVTLDPAVLALPDDPALADVARALEAGGFAAELLCVAMRFSP